MPVDTNDTFLAVIANIVSYSDRAVTSSNLYAPSVKRLVIFARIRIGCIGDPVADVTAIIATIGTAISYTCRNIVNGIVLHQRVLAGKVICTVVQYNPSSLLPCTGSCTCVARYYNSIGYFYIDTVLTV